MTALSIEPNDQVTYRLLHEDQDLLAVVKPARIVTLPGKGHDRDSLLNGLFARWGHLLQNVGKTRDFGLLHRLDRETSGIVLIALRPRAYDTLRQAFEDHTIEKYYWAVSPKAPSRPASVIKRPLAEFQGRGTMDRPGESAKKLCRISGTGKPSATAYRVLGSTATGTLLECRALTGRLHQVRVHLTSIGCPLFGDGLYAPPPIAQAAPRLALHAHRVALDHPTTGERLDLRTPWPADLRGLLRRLGLARPDMAGPNPAKPEADPPDAGPPSDDVEGRA